MTQDLTLLITAPPPSLLSELAQRRPAWQVLPLRDAAPPGLPSVRVWGFVDWLGPDMAGIELCRRLRDHPATRNARLIMVLDGDDADQRRRALQAGADDYLPGPIDATRLIERVEGPAEPVQIGLRPGAMSNGAITLDPQAHQVRVAGTLVPVRPNEFRLLAHFMQHRDQVFSRAALIGQLGKQDGAIDDRTVDVWVGRLRRALIAAGAPDPLRTVRSLGYVMDSVES